MANKKFFTDESLKSLIDAVKLYTSEAVFTKADASHTHIEYALSSEFDNLSDVVSTVSSLVDTYVLDIDYDTILSFDTSEVIFGKNTSSVLGQAMLGRMILG